MSPFWNDYLNRFDCSKFIKHETFLTSSSFSYSWLDILQQVLQSYKRACWQTDWCRKFTQSWWTSFDVSTQKSKSTCIHQNSEGKQPNGKLYKKSPKLMTPDQPSLCCKAYALTVKILNNNQNKPYVDIVGVSILMTRYKIAITTTIIVLAHK